jgi:hypothetical protein
MRSLVKESRKRQPSAADFRRVPKRAKLHLHGVTPFEFFSEAVTQPDQFLRMSPADTDTDIDFSVNEGGACPPTNTTNSTGAGTDNGTSTVGPRRFGLYGEALLRDCYTHLMTEIDAIIDGYNDENEDNIGNNRTLLLEIRGSAGIGKSTFLGLLMAEYKLAGMKNFALIYAPKVIGERSSTGGNKLACFVWIEGTSVMQKGSVEQLEPFLNQLTYIFMDGCSVYEVSFQEFAGAIVVAASPSVSTQNLRKNLGNRYTTLYMPPWSLDEAFKAADFLDVSRDVVEENYAHMTGIVRYFFNADSARGKVNEAVLHVNPKSIIKMVQSNECDKRDEDFMVHSLVLWKPKVKENGSFDFRAAVSFDLVSRYAEKMVAEKLAKIDLEELRNARLQLSAVAGSEGYAGALFEAFAVKTIRGGGTFEIVSLESTQKADKLEITIPKMSSEPVTIACNTLTESTVALSLVHVIKDGSNSYEPKFLWPLTSNFPTFDCFYFHTDGDVFPFQMTVAAKTHELKNTGAHQTMKYLANIRTCKRPYKAVFVCPKENDDPIKKQKFVGPVRNGKTSIIEEKAATEKMNGTFQQWILQL